MHVKKMEWSDKHDLALCLEGSVIDPTNTPIEARKGRCMVPDSCEPEWPKSYEIQSQ